MHYVSEFRHVSIHVICITHYCHVHPHPSVHVSVYPLSLPVLCPLVHVHLLYWVYCLHLILYSITFMFILYSIGFMFILDSIFLFFICGYLVLFIIVTCTLMLVLVTITHLWIWRCSSITITCMPLLTISLLTISLLTIHIVITSCVIVISFSTCDLHECVSKWDKVFSVSLSVIICYFIIFSEKIQNYPLNNSNPLQIQ